MPSIFPFRALRPTPAVASRVAAVPYDVVTTDEARQLTDGNPLSFLHVSRSELGLPSGTNPYGDVVYETAQRNFAQLVASAPLVYEDQPSFYLYRLQMGAHVQTGLAACYSVDEYDRDVIRKHEKTRKDKEDDRTRHIVDLRAQTGPVFLTYAAVPAIDAVAKDALTETPLFDFTAVDGVRHTIWRVTAPLADVLTALFADVPRLYIADGHHRAASASRARLHLATPGVPSEADRFLAVAFPHDQLQVLPYNRTVRDLNGRRPGEFLEALERSHTVTPGPATPQRKGEVSMLLAGHWCTVRLNPPAAGASPSAALDVSLLHDQILAPLLAIGDVRVDKRIDFLGGARGTSALERAVGSGAAAVAFSMHPVDVADLMTISDAGEIMPPKSTWFEPKLRDGLLIHVI
ncbi:MAG: DUF1015 domain-containing protein [Vicinamibacteria bacterium]|nr:DUF1015 domain-containing protein [Vicinamibacteria bacterium]